MFRLLLLTICFSCSFGVIKKGGDNNYVFEADREYHPSELERLSSKVVQTSKRDPKLGTVDQLFGPNQKPIKRIGIFVFESLVQPSFGGLSGQDLIYLNEAGKQIITENFLTVWEEGFPLLAPEIELVPMSIFKGNKFFDQYGMTVKDHILSDRHNLAPDDIFYLPPGKKITTTSILNPRGMRDHSLILVPGAELMKGPKFSEHAKYAVNELCREFKLDAVLILMSRVDWTAAHINKHSGEAIAEELTVKLEGTIMVPLSEYHERLKKLSLKGEYPSMSIAYRAYDSSIKTPIKISVEEDNKNFETIQNHLISPLMKLYRDMSFMMIHQMSADLKATH